MKQKTSIIIGLALLLFTACGQGQIKTPENVKAKFEEFKTKEKFLQDEKLFYPGIGDPVLKPILTEKINLAADDFRKLADKGNATDKDYQNTIKVGLDRFAEVFYNLTLKTVKEFAPILKSLWT